MKPWYERRSTDSPDSADFARDEAKFYAHSPQGETSILPPMSSIITTTTTNPLPPLPLTSEGHFEIDNSFLEHFTTCPRHAEYANIRKRISAKEKPALTFGSAFHKAMEYRYSVLKNQPPTPADEQDIYDKAIVPYFEQHKQPEDDHRTVSFLQEIVQEYNKRFNHENFSLMTDSQGNVLTEQTFSVKLLDYTLRNGTVIPVYYVGRIDLIVIIDGQIFVLDFKTASSLGVTKENELKVSPQFEGYAWGLGKTINKDVSGFIVRCARTKAKPGTTRGGWDKWWDECFMSHKEYFRPDQLKEWELNTIANVREFFYHYENGYLPQKKKACTLYGMCPYYDICYLPTSQRMQMLNSDQFVDNNWSPLKEI